MSNGQHVGEWIVDFYADKVPEPIETVRQAGAPDDHDDDSARAAVDEEITAADWWALTARMPGRFYVTAKHEQAPEASRAWAKVDIVNGEPEWADCKAPAFWLRRRGPGVAMPGEADGWTHGTPALVAVKCDGQTVVAEARAHEEGWRSVIKAGHAFARAGDRAFYCAMYETVMPITAIIRQRADGTPDITPRHPLADGEVFDPWLAAAETFGVDVDAVKAAAGCPDRWWFVYDYPDDGSDLVKAPTRRMAGELSIFMRGSDPPHDFDELTIEPATMDALAERCLAHDDDVVESTASGAESIQDAIDSTERACAAQVMSALKVADPTSADWPFALKAVHEAQRDAEDLLERCERERDHADRLIAAAGIEPHYPRADCVNEACELITRCSMVLASVLGCSAPGIAGWPDEELRVAGKRIGMTLAGMPEAMRKWLGGEPGSRLPEPGDEPTYHYLLCRAADLWIAREVATGKPTAIESALGRGTEGERRLIMTLDNSRDIGVYTWTDGNDEDDDGPWMATPGWWGDGEPDDVFGPNDVVIWARLPEQVAP